MPIFSNKNPPNVISNKKYSILTLLLLHSSSFFYAPILSILKDTLYLTMKRSQFLSKT